MGTSYRGQTVQAKVEGGDTALQGVVAKEFGGGYDTAAFLVVS